MSDKKNSNGHSAGYVWGVHFIGLYQVALVLALMAVLFFLWPERPAKDAPWAPLVIEIGNWKRNIGDDGRLMLIVLCTGALGSYVHAATSFTSYVGNRRLVLSWAWWYMLRPFLGSALALVLYFVVRGGLLSTSTAASDVSVFGVASVAGLAGMFSKQATDKLREVFDSLFRTEKGDGDDARADKLGANLPVTSGMIERRKIAAFVIPEGTGHAGVPIVALHGMLGGVVTRIPVLDHTSAAVCVIHQSLLYKFLADRSIAAVKSKLLFDIEQFTLAELLDTPGMKELVQDSIAYIPENALLSDAKDRMERTPNCQDIFVTAHGLPGEPVLGWLTDAEVRRASKA